MANLPIIPKNERFWFLTVAILLASPVKGSDPAGPVAKKLTDAAARHEATEREAEIERRSTGNNPGISLTSIDAQRGGSCVLLDCAGDEDVTCLSLDDTAQRAVAHLEFQGNGENCGQGAINGAQACTGVLLRDADDNTNAGYLLTAGHCICTQSLADTLKVRWVYETPSCNAPDPGTGSIPFATGLKLLKFKFPDGGSNMDYALLRLLNDPDAGNGPSQAEWTNVTPANNDLVRAIHHPCGSYKRYSEGHVEYHCNGSPSLVQTYVEWTQGITQDGSSGGPLFNANWEVVGANSGKCRPDAFPFTCANRSTTSAGYTRMASTLTHSEAPHNQARVEQYLNYVAPDDPHENNDTFATAANLVQTGNHSLKLVDFDDYFRVTLCEQHDLNLSVTFTSSSLHLNGGSLTLQLLQANEAQIDSDSAATGLVSVSGSGLPAGDYYVRVFRTTGGGFFLNTNNPPTLTHTGAYTLNVNVVGAGDCNHNDIPDDCEVFADCNSNTVRDICDIEAGTSADCQPNAVPDECEFNDCNQNCQDDNSEAFSRLYVNVAASGADDGTSWADAFVRLQDALSTATCSGTVNEIWVAKGTYKPTAKSCQIDADCGGPPNACIGGVCDWDQPRTQTFQLPNGVAIYGGFASGETLLSQRNHALNTTILSGDLLNNDGPNFADNGENSYHIISAAFVDFTAILDGFTVTAGNANGSSPDNRGGGIHIDTGNPTLVNCTFSGNSANFLGGGVYAENGTNNAIANCRFMGNSAGSGGGVFNWNADARISGCTFRGNTASLGGALYNEGGSPVVSECTFAQNSAGSGGGMFNDLVSNPTVINCIFAGNSATAGGAMYNFFQASPTVTNCMFSGNSASDGGGIFNDQGSPIVTNCTFSENTTSQDGGGIFNGSGSPTMANCILWRNSDAGGMDESAQIHADSGTPTVNYSIVQGGWTGAGANNSSSDPLFFDPDGTDAVIGTLDDNLRVRSGSPAIDSGDNASLPADTLDLDGDSNTAEPIPFDLAGNARIIQFIVPVVDRGAYEYFPDCNNNGILDATDIAGPVGEDCNSTGWAGNGIPDECDIESCTANSACADCNLNGIPDGCDIGSGFSLDTAPADGVPDECAEFTALCSPSSNAWSCFENWNIPNDFYPNNNSPSGAAYSVVLSSGDDVCLDVSVTIDDIVILEGATLRNTDADPACDPAPMARHGATALNIATGDGMLIHGELFVASNNQVNALLGPAVVGSGGVYEADPSATGNVSASLTVESVLLNGSDCSQPPACPSGGEMTLTDSMSVTTDNFTIDGSLANGHCHLDDRSGSGGAARVNHTPPTIRIRNTSILDVNSSMMLSGAAGFLHESSQPVTVGGDWQNESVSPDCFEALAGTIRLDGSVAQEFEVAAIDTGTTGPSADQFRIGRLEVAAGRSVTFVDSFDNDLLGQSSCGEAQYVSTLVLEAGSTVTIQNCRLYYDTLIKDTTAQMIFSGCGEAQAQGNVESALADPSGLKKPRAISFVPPSGAIAGGMPSSAIRVTLVSLHRVAPPYTGGPSIPFVSFEGEIRWVGPPAQYVESSSNPTPFKGSALQCTPHYQDWSTVGLFHVFGSAIVPSSSYRVQILAESCLGIEDRCTAVSPSLIVNTSRWADVETPYNPPDFGQPSFSDISALVAKFRSAAGAPIKARALLAGDDAFGNFTTMQQDLSFTHIAACVDAFRGKPYPHMIAACP